jgi:hypothetical protein
VHVQPRHCWAFAAPTLAMETMRLSTIDFIMDNPFAANYGTSTQGTGRPAHRLSGSNTFKAEVAASNTGRH